MTAPNPRWRPSDADRDTYSAVIAQAYSDGRIAADDMQARTALVYEAERVADLDTIVEDLPGAPNQPQRPKPAAVAPNPGRAGRAVAVFALVGLLTTGAVIGSHDASDPVPDAVVLSENDPVDAAGWPAAPVPEIDTELTEPLSAEAIQEIFDAAAAADMTEIEDLTIWADGSARIFVRTPGEHRALDSVDIDGGLAGTREPWRTLTPVEPDEETFYTWDDVSADVIAQVVADSPATGGVPEATVSHVSVSRGMWEPYAVQIRVYLDNRFPSRVDWWGDGELDEVIE